MTIHEFVQFFDKLHELQPQLDMSAIVEEFIAEAEPDVRQAKERGFAWLGKIKQRNQESLEKLKNVFAAVPQTEDTPVDLIERELDVKQQEYDAIYMQLQQNPNNQAPAKKLKELELVFKDLEKQRNDEFMRSK